MSDPAACPRPHLTGDAARWLLAVTGNMTVRLDNPHAAQTTAMAAAVRAELAAIVAEAEAVVEPAPDAGDEGGAEGLPAEEPADE